MGTGHSANSSPAAGCRAGRTAGAPGVGSKPQAGPAGPSAACGSGSNLGLGWASRRGCALPGSRAAWAAHPGGCIGLPTRLVVQQANEGVVVGLHHPQRHRGQPPVHVPQLGAVPGRGGRRHAVHVGLLAGEERQVGQGRGLGGGACRRCCAGLGRGGLRGGARRRCCAGLGRWGLGLWRRLCCGHCRHPFKCLLCRHDAEGGSTGRERGACTG